MLEMYQIIIQIKKNYLRILTNIYFVTYIHKLYMTMRVKKEQIVIPEFIEQHYIKFMEFI